MSNINSKTEIIKLNSKKMMKPSGTSTPLNMIQDSFNISSSTSPSRSSPLNFYDDNKTNNKPVIYHNYTTTTTGTTSSINHDTDDNDDDDDYNYYEGKNDDSSSQITDDSDDSNNIHNKLYICNIDSHNQQYLILNPNQNYNTNSKLTNQINNFGYYDEYAYKKASIEIFLSKFKKIVNDFIRENQSVTRDNLVQQTVNGNNSKCDYIFADSRKIEKLKSYGNKIYVCLKIL